jgi:hypothetical protein
MIVIVGYGVIVAVRALVRFAGVESPADPPSDPWPLSAKQQWRR